MWQKQSGRTLVCAGIGTPQDNTVYNVGSYKTSQSDRKWVWVQIPP